MPEAWIKSMIDSAFYRGLSTFKPDFLAQWIMSEEGDDVDAMGVLCMGGEL